ncbi:MAG: hypothetical protein ABSG59_09610 [Verrucomicrobiota bacterium]
MKKDSPIQRTGCCLMAIVLTSLAAALTANAATALNGRLIARPLTPGDIAKYALPASLEYSGGLNTLGIGTPVYLEADANIAIPASQITNVTFALTNAPIGSQAAIAASPFGTNVGVYEPADQLVYQVAGRALLRPDVPGQYTVTATIGTFSNGTATVSYTVTAAVYQGAQLCELCHSGSLDVTEEYQYWSNTAHAMIFTEGINGTLTSHYNSSCIKCHTVGYDTNAASLLDGGFYAVALSNNWTFPTTLAATNFASMPTALQNLANIQCENCHGPGSEHFMGAGDTNKITMTVFTGDCTQCHDDPPTHADGTQWYASKHAVTTTTPSGAGRDQCVECHTAYGFITRIQNSTVTNTISFPPTNTTYAAIGCQTCHEPHGQTVPMDNSYLIRTLASVTLGDGTVITNAGLGELCLECHHARDGGASNNVANWPIGIRTWVGASEPPSSRDFGPHEGVQGDMIEGANAITYGKAIPSSAHRYAVSNLCVGCHMQTLASTDPGFLLSGGHTFEMSYSMVTNGVTNIVDQTGACIQCHGPISSFDFPVADQNGAIVGIQTQVQQLLNQLSTLLPNASGVVDGSVKTSLPVTTNWTTAQLNAAYNWQFVSNDGSMGVHNANFAVGLLQASIADLTGTSVPGGLPDKWEIEYFGSTTNAAGAPDADPAGDGIPNWLKYSLGLDPRVAGMQVPGGVVYANGAGNLGGSTNTIQIYTAAEISFDTVAGTAYQIQEATALSQGWQNIGGPIVATNTGSFSYLTPTRDNVQQFFRVAVVPNP